MLCRKILPSELDDPISPDWQERVTSAIAKCDAKSSKKASSGSRPSRNAGKKKPSYRYDIEDDEGEDEDEDEEGEDDEESDEDEEDDGDDDVDEEKSDGDDGGNIVGKKSKKRSRRLDKARRNKKIPVTRKRRAISDGEEEGGDFNAPRSKTRKRIIDDEDGDEDEDDSGGGGAEGKEGKGSKGARRRGACDESDERERAAPKRRSARSSAVAVKSYLPRDDDIFESLSDDDAKKPARAQRTGKGKGAAQVQVPQGLGKGVIELADFEDADLFQEDFGSGSDGEEGSSDEGRGGEQEVRTKPPVKPQLKLFKSKVKRGGSDDEDSSSEEAPSEASFAPKIEAVLARKGNASGGKLYLVKMVGDSFYEVCLFLFSNFRLSVSMSDCENACMSCTHTYIHTYTHSHVHIYYIPRKCRSSGRRALNLLRCLAGRFGRTGRTRGCSMTTRTRAPGRVRGSLTAVNRPRPCSRLSRSA